MSSIVWESCQTRYSSINKRSIQKRANVAHHIAQTLNIIPKLINTHTREQRSLPAASKQLVIQFYTHDDITYAMPGKRDYITVKDDHGKTTTLQKRILLYSIRESYQLFLAEAINTNHSFSRSSFSDLRSLKVLDTILTIQQQKHLNFKIECSDCVIFD